MKVAWRQIKQLLNASTGIIEYAEEHVIAFSTLGQTVDLSQQVAKFLLAEIAQQGAKRLLRGNCQNGTTRSSQSWFSPRDIAKEGLYGRQSRIARSDLVAAAGLKVCEEI